MHKSPYLADAAQSPPWWNPRADLAIPYLAEVPRARSDLLLCAVVDPARVVQDVLLPLVLVVQKDCVLCRDTTASSLCGRSSLFKGSSCVSMPPTTRNPSVSGRSALI